MSTENGREVTLFKTQVIQAMQTVSNGDVIFTNLEAGDYVVQVNGVQKEVRSNLKQ